MATKTETHEAELSVDLIAVGHGDALLIHWKPVKGSPSVILIDGGPKGSAKAITAALGDIGASKIDLAVLSHCDADHVDGLVEYVSTPHRLKINRYWGPCVPAFRRHNWLFPRRITRGLDEVKKLEEQLKEECVIRYPVEGAEWVSSDGDLVVRVLSPAGRLIERLLVGEDSDDLFLHYPTPLGWLIGQQPPLDLDNSFQDLRAALASGEITSKQIPSKLPPSPRTFNESDIADVARQIGIDHEFFGNNVLNDTSIVLLINVRIGAVRRRLLFPGDIENFAYLMANYPTGLGCDIVKAPHHGSRSYVESNHVAYDEVWQWLRPKATLVSANGKHGLPRREFREAVLRYGSTLFCTSRRSREILIGQSDEESCHKQFECHLQEQKSVHIKVAERIVESHGIACSTGTTSGVIPIIQIRQHVIEPSNILERFSEGELKRHVDWVKAELRSVHKDRFQAGGEATLEGVSSKTLARMAIADQRYAAAVNIELILERAASQGEIWISQPHPYRSIDRYGWVMPSGSEWKELETWIKNYEIVQLAVLKRKVGLNPHELLLEADTGFLAMRAAQKFSFPEVMFHDAIWPRLVKCLIKKRTIATCNYMNDHEEITAIVVLAETDLKAAYSKLVKSLPAEPIHSLLLVDSRSDSHHLYPLQWPRELDDVMAPLWQKTNRFQPMDIYYALTNPYYREYWEKGAGIRAFASEDDCENYLRICSLKRIKQELTNETARAIFIASFFAYLRVLSS